MPWKITIQSNFRRTKHEPLSLYNLQDDPEEKRNLIKNPEFKETVDRMYKEYMDIVQSGQPTVPGR